MSFVNKIPRNRAFFLANGQPARFAWFGKSSQKFASQEVPFKGRFEGTQTLIPTHRELRDSNRRGDVHV